MTRYSVGLGPYMVISNRVGEYVEYEEARKLLLRASQLLRQTNALSPQEDVSLFLATLKQVHQIDQI